MILSCKSASRLVSQSLDRPLNWQERLALRFHLVICRHCRRFGKQLQQLRLAINAMVQQTERDTNITLKPEAKQNIANAINQHY